MKRLALCMALIYVIWACNITSARDRGFALSIAWSPDGETIAVGSTNGVWLFDSEFNEVGYVEIRPDSRKLTLPISLEWNAAGNLLAVGYPTVRDDGGDIQIINVDDLEIITRIYLKNWEEWLWSQAVWHPTENLIAAGTWLGNTYVWDAQTGEALFHFEESDEKNVFNSNSTLAVCWFTESVIAIVTGFETYVVNFELNETLQSFDIRTVIDHVDCDSDYRVIAGLRKIIDLKSGAFVDFERIEIDRANSMFPFEADLWPADQDVEFSPDGSKILRIEEGCLIQVFDGHTGRLLAQIPGGIYLVQESGAALFRDSLAWHPDGSRFATVGQFGGIRILDAESYEVLQRFDGFETSYTTTANVLFNRLSEGELNVINASKMRCIEALNSELPEK